jgi:hypothetical protein
MFATRRTVQAQGTYCPSTGHLPPPLTVCCSAKDVVAALIKRLAHRNANVQLYTLEVKLQSSNIWEID